MGERVLVAKKENLKEDQKELAGRFITKALVIEKFEEEDSYLVRILDSGKIQKRLYLDLKKDSSHVKQVT